MKARNVVLAGDYKGHILTSGRNGEIEPKLSTGIFKKRIPLTKETVESMEVINQATIQSAANGIVSTAISTALLGPVGLLAGRPQVEGIYMVAIKLKNGKNFLAEIDDDIYRALIQWMY
ncbi:hypothetical protein NE664_12400 [Anaerotignum faecicola]|nr:hypothetical protein [Anaerotignum faecicola]